MKMTPATVEEATPADIPGIIAVLEENLLVNKGQPAVVQLEQSGFLIARHSKDDLLRWVQDKTNHVVLVCREAGEVVGYIIGCDVKALSPEMQGKFNEIGALRNIMASNPVLYHKQIAVKSARKGLGGPLLRRFFEVAARNGYRYIACIIVHEPVLNRVSVRFHEKHGFELLGMTQVDDMKDGVYLKKHAGN